MTAIHFAHGSVWLQFDGKHIVSGSLDTSIRVWDVDSGTCLHTLTGHQSLTSGMEIQDGLLVSGNADSTVKVWDINSGACLQTLTGEADCRQHMLPQPIVIVMCWRQRRVLGATFENSNANNITESFLLRHRLLQKFS